ncbi:MULTISPECIES: Asp-tRNA(Asn)/Glu-tRNA(Gln) amidotransferase subunit GatC [unclassified Pseudactinotalea]|uniref:Asp-tRNA(Asn)/Glu-tRNA(Gln) amidotransferase subunit GatC n=1 Tax=unclassified Pseudactinotalea TaxID=2649176 RepID=UPI00128BD465|nr:MULTISPECIES: Asp-tRNA(Asn)/Glu-tRNA(Gln) amidotransferase subunit GatC [unclassified Pseudactinotalea]MPV50330.1 Asp-tRNA(Asn)/Glu-tRNA(Gln) amidotransferase subunit GatC [Pseudactinotalea sp. HY160]QGH68929.1 Asp-tRNA(Asn)/Glu-tRNA(Gln) amidotransferase subunit GatC [Pseudactinotalea sp. HY158]
MPTINPDEVARLADLARIDLTQDETARLAAELDVIVAAVATVSEAVSGDVPATSHPLPLSNVFRDDVVGPTLDPEVVLAQAPAAAEGRFAVPQILGEDA